MAVPPPPPPPPRPSRTPERNDRARPGRPAGRPDGGWPRWVAWMLLAVVLAVVVLPFLLPGEDREKIAYNTFLQRVEQGDVREVSINNDTSGIKGTLDDGTKFSTTGPALIPDEHIDLINANVPDTDYDSPQPNFFASILPLLLPALLIIGF